MTPAPLPLGLVLAGGLARRMGGGDKTRIRIGGKTILERVLARFKPQCTAVILNANAVPAGRSGGALVGGATGGRRAACLRALGRLAASRGRLVAGRAAGGPAQGARRGRHAQDRDLDGA